MDGEPVYRGGRGILSVIEQSVESLPDRVAHQIVRMIRQRELVPGDKIPPEMEITETLHVSRGTVREAIKLLVSRNILQVRRGCGTYVSRQMGQMDDPLGLQYIEDRRRLFKDLLDVRLLLEPWAAQQAARFATKAAVKDIFKACEATERMIHEGKPHMQADMQFHIAIAAATKNIVLPRLTPIVHQTTMLFTEETNSSLLPETVATHRLIADAIAGHDRIAASEIMREHIQMIIDVADEIPIEMVNFD